MQDDNSKTFTIHTTSNEKYTSSKIVPLYALVEVKKHPDSESLCQKGLFPPDFKFCPYCGSNLLEINDDSYGQWIPPYGSGNGLKVYSGELISSITIGSDESSGSKFLLPPQDGLFAFCSIKLGAKQRLLVAVNRNLGCLWVYHPDDCEWRSLSGDLGGDSLPVWSWSLAVDSFESGLCLPTDQGPVWLTVDWGSGSVQADRTSGQSVGGAVCVGKYVLAPVSCSNGFAVVYRKEGENGWSECAPASDAMEVLAHLRGDVSPGTCLGIPVVDEDRQIAYWPGRGGYVRVVCRDPSGVLSWEFRSYESDDSPAKALVELGPPYRRNGSRPGFWQLCEDRDHAVRDGIVNKIIKLDGDEGVDTEIVECGQFLTTGRASFSWADDYWDDILKRNPRIKEQEELRLPLLQFGEKGLALIAKAIPWEGRDEFGTFSDIFFNKAVKAMTYVRLVVEGAGIPERALRAEGVSGAGGDNGKSLFRVKIAQIPELSAFVHGRSLYVYFPENNDCFRWPLELMEK